jgi:hypothetical protein
VRWDRGNGDRRKEGRYLDLKGRELMLCSIYIVELLLLIADR